MFIWMNVGGIGGMGLVRLAIYPALFIWSGSLVCFFLWNAAFKGGRLFGTDCWVGGWISSSGSVYGRFADWSLDGWVNK